VHPAGAVSLARRILETAEALQRAGVRWDAVNDDPGTPLWPPGMVEQAIAECPDARGMPP
jgi:hypothetical protein